MHLGLEGVPRSRFIWHSRFCEPFVCPLYAPYMAEAGVCGARHHQIFAFHLYCAMELVHCHRGPRESLNVTNKLGE